MSLILDQPVAPAPDSRAARLQQPRTRDVARELAVEFGLCLRPVLLRRTDLATGETSIVEVPCGNTRAAVCPSCAERARKLRMQQCREGWHLADEPIPPPDTPTSEQRALVNLRAHLEFARHEAQQHGERDQLPELDAEIAWVDEEISQTGLRGKAAPELRDTSQRRVRSTRRRDDASDLPRHPVDARTIGRVYTAPDGKTYRPSMFISPTLPSYGPVHTTRRRAGQRIPCECGQIHGDGDPAVGTPVDPATYDYGRQARDAIFFAALLDRWWQNLRRAVGWNVQYFGCVELQRRLAPHAHFAIRGTIPRQILRQVATGTYHQVWWPRFDQPSYSPESAPQWDETRQSYLDPDNGQPLPTWDEALDAIDADPQAQPAHIVRFGQQVNIKGISPGSKDAERTVRYITKYLTKDLTASAETAVSDPQRAHQDRLRRELRYLPCSPRCANWLLYGVQPREAPPGLKPGYCKGKIHQPANLGITGRRVLVSRQWSNKTLADHRADNKNWVKALLGLQEIGTAANDQCVFELAKPTDPDVPPAQYRLLRAISQRTQWRNQIEAARERAGPPNVSAIASPNEERSEHVPSSTYRF